jgi:hypothetical protein
MFIEMTDIVVDFSSKSHIILALRIVCLSIASVTRINARDNATEIHDLHASHILNKDYF